MYVLTSKIHLLPSTFHLSERLLSVEGCQRGVDGRKDLEPVHPELHSFVHHDLRSDEVRSGIPRVGEVASQDTCS